MRTRKNTTRKQTRNFNYEPLKTELIKLGEHLKSNFERNLKKIKKDTEKVLRQAGKFSVNMLEKTTESLKSLDERKTSHNLAKTFLSPISLLFIVLLLSLPTYLVVGLVVLLLILRLLV